MVVPCTNILANGTNSPWDSIFPERVPVDNVFFTGSWAIRMDTEHISIRISMVDFIEKLDFGKNRI
jgi:hypothetical protein